MQKQVIFFVICAGVLLLGCGGSADSSKNHDKSEAIKNELSKEKISKNADAEQLRRKAKVAGSASKFVGYDGDRIDRDLNKIIDKSEDLKKQYGDLGVD